MKKPPHEIVQEFTTELLVKLEEQGYQPVGVAGGIIYFAGSEEQPSNAHTFCTFSSDVITSEGAPVDGPSFMKDVSKLLIQSAEKGES